LILDQETSPFGKEIDVCSKLGSVAICI
jgi:hypothetical protein